MNKTIRLSFVAVALLVAAPAPAQNLVTNFDFDANVAGWGVDSVDVSVAWNSSDYASSLTSGSAQVTNASTTPGNGIGINQCVAVTAGNLYDIGGWVFIPASQTTTGSIQIGANWYSGLTCNGSGLGGSTRAFLNLSTTGTWTFIRVQNQVAPVGAQSALFLAFPSKVEAGGTLVALFDHLFMGPPGTTPVSLQRIDAK